MSMRIGLYMCVSRFVRECGNGRMSGFGCECMRTGKCVLGYQGRKSQGFI